MSDDGGSTIVASMMMMNSAIPQSFDSPPRREYVSHHPMSYYHFYDVPPSPSLWVKIIKKAKSLFILDNNP